MSRQDDRVDVTVGCVLPDHDRCHLRHIGAGVDLADGVRQR